MLVGEIGIPRREFLYELRYWEIICITRGYFRRYHPMYDAARIVAHQVHYCMGVPKGQSPKTPYEWLPFTWERTDNNGEPSDLPSTEEIERLRQEMLEYNARQQEGKA